MLKSNLELKLETPEAEMLRLLREIHAAVVRPPLNIKPVRPPKPKRVMLTDSVLELMRDSKMRTVYEVWRELNDKGISFTENSVNATLSNFCNKGILTRLRKSLYQLTPGKE